MYVMSAFLPRGYSTSRPERRWSMSLPRLRQTGHMTDRSLMVTKEYVWLLGTLALCAVTALVLIKTIPTVNELPEGTSTAIEYVVDVTVARFAAPVAVFLFLAALGTALGHNRGDGRPGVDFFTKVCNFGAATFSMWAVVSGIWVGVAVS